jgi:hypothetical protein
MQHALSSLFLGLSLVLVAATAAGGAPEGRDARFSGAWRIAAGEPAGIDDDAPAEPLPTLIGATVRFDATTIEAPHPLGCGGARYEVQALPAEMLFQGTPGDTARTLANALDLSPIAAPTLMARCDTGVFDYHLTQGSGATGPNLLIMLDRVIYTLERASVTQKTP